LEPDLASLASRLEAITRWATNESDVRGHATTALVAAAK